MSFGLSDDLIARVNNDVELYSKSQGSFTDGTRRDGTGWTSITLEWGKRAKPTTEGMQGQQMRPLQAILEERYPEECALLGAAGLLKAVAMKGGKFRVVDRDATWTPTRGQNKGKIQSGTLHDVFIPNGVARPLFDPFAAAAPQPTK